MATKLVYDKGTCGRCGGTGHYSYNTMHGTICYGCSGRKITLTRAGAKAAAAITAFIATHFSVPVTDLKPGDFIKYDGKARKVKAVLPSDTRYGHTAPDGETVWTPGVLVKFDKPYKTAWGPVDSIGMVETSTVVKAPTGADWDTVVAFAKTLKKGVTLVDSDDAPAPAPVAPVPNGRTF